MCAWGRKSRRGKESSTACGEETSSLRTLPCLPLIRGWGWSLGHGAWTEGSDPHPPFMVGSVLSGAQVLFCKWGATPCSTTGFPGAGGCVSGPHKERMLCFARCLLRVSAGPLLPTYANRPPSRPCSASSAWQVPVRSKGAAQTGSE